MAMRSDPVSAEQLFNRSDDGNRYELIRGELHMMSPAGGRHGRVAHNLGLILGRHVRRAGLGAVYAAETGFLIARDPDTVLRTGRSFRQSPEIAANWRRRGVRTTRAGFGRRGHFAER